jgi:hypothetical protein
VKDRRLHDAGMATEGPVYDCTDPRWCAIERRSAWLACHRASIFSRLSPDGGIGGRARFISRTREGMMDRDMPERFESGVTLGDIVSRLIAARDAAIRGDSVSMANWLGQVKYHFDLFEKDCKIMLEESK